MARVGGLLALGMSAELAKAVSGDGQEVTATGTTIADALAISTGLTSVTGGGATTGVQLPDDNGLFIIANQSGSNCLVYPHSSAGIINGGSAGAAVTVADNEVAFLFRASTLDWAGGVAVGF